MNENNCIRQRRDFLKKGLAGVASLAAIPSFLSADKKKEEKTKEKKKSAVIYRTLGKTGIKLPIVSMGVMNADNPELVKSALDAGITHLDTAHVYQRGKNEEMVGSVIKNYPRKNLIIATKIVGDGMDRQTGLFTAETTAKGFLEKFELSLKRLGTDYVDILYLHSIARKESALFEPLTSAMKNLKKQGKARFIGLSTHRNEPEVIRAAADSGFYDVVLTAYNFHQTHVQEVEAAIDYAAKKGLGIVAMKTQAGVYWDKEKQHPINMKAALKWALKNPNVHTSIPGFTTFDQLQLDLSVMEDSKLTPQEIEDLKPKAEGTPLAGLFCQQCSRCIAQCTFHLNIPDMMRSYMYAFGYRNLLLAKDTLTASVKTANPCSNCSDCSIHCTMGFDIKNKIREILPIYDIPEQFIV